MDESMRTLGERIIRAARLAAAVHQRLERTEHTQWQQSAVGGAGGRIFTDGELSLVDDRPRRSFLAERRAE